MPRKPDRFERMADNFALGKGNNKFFYANDLVHFLRKEHRWMVRMVNSMVTDYKRMAVDAVKNGYDQDNKYTMKAEACKTVLYQLEQRRK